jgi:integrase/recombinase XerD
MQAEDRELVGRFKEMLSAERGAAENTLQAYSRDLDDFLAFLSARRGALVGTMPADISAYLRAAAEGGLAPASRARRLSAIRQLFKFLAAEGIVAEDPASAFTGPKRARPLPRTLSVAEVDRLIETARRRIEGTMGRERVRALRLHALIEMLYATGMRVSELVTLPRSVLTGDGRVLTIRGKGGRERIVPLNQAARSALDRYLNVGFEDGVAPMLKTRWLFASRGARGHLPRQRLAQELKELAAEAGRSRARVAARPAPRLCQPSARPRRRPALGAAAAGSRRHLHDADLYARAGRAAEEARLRPPSFGRERAQPRAVNDRGGRVCQRPRR